MTGPVTFAADAQATVQAVQDNAQRLGLTWNRRRGTVASDNPLMVTLDADTEPTAATSMAGPLAVDQRVYVDIIPPSGQFVCGVVGGADPVGAQVSMSGQSLPDATPATVTWSSAPLDSSGFVASLPTTGVVIPAGAGGIYALTASMAMTATGTRNFVTIFVNGVRFVRSSLSPGEDFVGVSGTRTLEAGDTITVDAFQNSGGAATMTGDLWVLRVG